MASLTNASNSMNNFFESLINDSEFPHKIKEQINNDGIETLTKLYEQIFKLNSYISYYNLKGKNKLLNEQTLLTVFKLIQSTSDDIKDEFMNFCSEDYKYYLIEKYDYQINETRRQFKKIYTFDQKIIENFEPVLKYQAPFQEYSGNLDMLINNLVSIESRTLNLIKIFEENNVKLGETVTTRKKISKDNHLAPKNVKVMPLNN